MVAIPGIDYLLAAGNKHVDYIDTMVKYHPRGWAAGFLLRAPGCSNGICAARALANDGCLIIRLHGYWTDNNHTYTESDIDIAVRQARITAKFKEENPAAYVYYSPWLEHRAHRDLFKKCRKACRNVLPKEIKLVSSGPYIGGIRENHGDTHAPKGSYIYSYDGLDALEDKYFENRKIQHRDAILYMYWTPRCNLKKSLNDKTPRADRTAVLKPRDIKRMREMGNAL